MRSAVRCSALVAIAASQIAGGCASPSMPTRVATAPSASSSIATTDGGAARSNDPLRGRHALAEPSIESLPMSLVAAPGGRALFAITQVAGERTALARRIDSASGAMGPLLRFVDEWIITAVDAPDGGATIVTSSARKVCVASFRAGADRAARRACIDAAPIAIAPLGDRLAMIELDIAEPAPKRRAHVDVRVRWASLACDIDATTSATGLRFDRPLEGMTLIDSASRTGAIDLLWYEPSLTRRTKSRLGSARLGAGSLRADGSFDAASRRALYDGDLEYGGLAGRRAPRLVTNGAETALVTSSRRGATCEAIRVEPSLGVASSSPSGCAIDPIGLATLGASAFDANAKLDALLALDPRRVVGQARGDGSLVTWVGDRAWFVGPNGALRSFDRASGAIRDERAPFGASRSRIAWSAIERDGEGLAFAEGRLHRLDPSGATTTRAGALTRLDANGHRAVRAFDPAGADRHRAARIADTWWIARGDVVRVAPEPLAAASLAGRAHPDATVLVGGTSRGLFLEVAGATLRVTALDPNGAAHVLDDRSASQVRAGFDAVERRHGGAIVAGPSDRDPTRAVSFMIDRDGHASTALPISIALIAGDSVRVVALPAGGALVADVARRRVAWLDDDAHEVAAAEWSSEHADAICIDGEPARVVVPTPSPGVLVRVADFASDACVVGDPTWTTDGTLRWFGSATRGIDSVAEVGVVAVQGIAPTPSHAHRTRAAAYTAASLASIVARFVSAPAPACSVDMVSIAGRFCIDRYEASLVDATTGESISPDYSATPSFFDLALADWATGRERWGDAHARAFPLPFIPSWQRGAAPAPIAIARRGARPNGYVQGLVAEAACAAAGKRLCSRDEFRTACRGDDDTMFPYGATFVDGACNVRRDDHPAALLHDNASLGHLDPRLDRVVGADGPLLRTTGASPACRSRWGADAVYDLVGNIDEWIDDPNGAFAGGFFSRTTRAGCDAIITAHPKVYLDYSTGVRCCTDAN